MRFCQNSGLAGLGSPHPRNGEGTLLACPDCTSTATTKRKGRTALGSRRFRCRACRRRFHERTGTPFNDRQDPTDSVRLAVRWRLRDTLGFRDVVELLLQRGDAVTHEPIRNWECRCAPLLADRLRAKRRGHAGRSWYLDETYGKVAGRWCSRYRALDCEGVLLDSMRSAHRDKHAARRFLRRLVDVAERKPPRVTTDKHPPYRRAIRWILGRTVRPRCNQSWNNRIEQDHRAVKQRSRPMLGFGSFASAVRCCSAFDALRQDVRVRQRRGEQVPLAEQRRLFVTRWRSLIAGDAGRIGPAARGERLARFVPAPCDLTEPYFTFLRHSRLSPCVTQTGADTRGRAALQVSKARSAMLGAQWVCPARSAGRGPTGRG